MHAPYLVDLIAGAAGIGVTVATLCSYVGTPRWITAVLSGVLAMSVAAIAMAVSHAT